MLSEITDSLGVIWHILVFLLAAYVISSLFLSLETKIEAESKRRFKLGFKIFLIATTVAFPILLSASILCKSCFLTFLYGPARVLNGDVWMDLNGRECTIDITDGTELGFIAHLIFRIAELFVGFFFFAACYKGIKHILAAVAPTFYEQAVELIKHERH